MSKLMSEKAKGKQRAVDPGPAEPTAPPSRDLVVRFTEGIQDLSLHVEEKDSVRVIKSKIRAARPELHNRRLRLIHSGRLLTDNTELYAFLTALEDRQRRAATVNPDALSSGEADAQVLESTSSSHAPVPTTAYLHCSVGPQFAEEEGEDEGHEQTTQIKPLRGFDRLAGAGFSESDIANFRRQFHSRASAEYLSTAEFATDEEYEEHARTLEEQWIESIDGGTGTSSRGDPAGTAILQGILVGFFFPLLPFFFFSAQKMPVFWANGSAFESLGSVVFSRRMQMGLVVGFMVNFLLGMWRYLWGSL